MPVRLMLLPIFVFSTLISGGQPPKPARAAFNQGKKLISQGLFYEAVPFLKKAVSLYSNYDSAWLEWGNLYARMKKPDSAIYLLTRALKPNPKMVSAYISLGKIYKDDKSNCDSAVKNYSRALKFDSTNKEALYNMAWCYNSKSDFNNAITYASKILESDANYKPAFGELAFAFRFSKKYDEALLLFKKYSSISTIDIPVYYCGLIYLETGKYDDLQKTIEELMKRNAKAYAESLKKKWDQKKDTKPPGGA